jgi:hypothetical protein
MEAFFDWLEVGINNGWISDVACITHEGLPSTPQEAEAIDEGWDLCIPAVRIWHDEFIGPLTQMLDSGGQT